MIGAVSRPRNNWRGTQRWIEKEIGYQRLERGVTLPVKVKRVHRGDSTLGSHAKERKKKSCEMAVEGKGERGRF